MNNDMCDVIAQYENAKGFTEEERCTEYMSEFGSYVFRMDVSRGKIMERYSEAKESTEGKYLADGKKIIAVFQITLAHNVKDSSSFPLQNEEIMMQEYFNKKTYEKMLGIKYEDNIYYLIRQQKDCFPELIGLPMALETRLLERLDEIRNRWFKRILEEERLNHQKQINEIISAGERTSKKQENFNFLREITKRMKTNKKVFIEEHMEGYDFREVDLSDAIFISCILTNSNFSGCNMENAVFVNCTMNDCMYYGAMLNNCRAMYGGKILYMDEKIRKDINDTEMR